MDEVNLSGHLCWAYDDPAAFRAGAARDCAAGIASGQRVAVVGDADVADLRAMIASVDGIEERIARGDVQLTSTDETYGAGHVIDPEAQVARYTAATAAAVAVGYTGLRVIAEVTALVRTPEQRAAFARYEHLVDRVRLTHPFVAVCAYDLAELGAVAVGEIACLHPGGRGGSAPFRLHASPGAAFALAGDVDVASAERFARALERAMSQASSAVGRGDDLVVDLTPLSFIDHRGLMALDDRAGALGHRILLRGGPTTVGRVVDVLRLGNLTVERAA